MSRKKGKQSREKSNLKKINYFDVSLIILIVITAISYIFVFYNIQKQEEYERQQLESSVGENGISEQEQIYSI
ncbi:hypothetical protein [Mechercharimyces sp. CAU 1602]|uniref:hypothetical protein n=1 Tax=Mechercharimyces sp. CAU 1602 TaxID=2973933 RepID=UPI0021611458|nr:hypothetical protein [Mechercharimyces sp. CAU 1602]MCS1351333.1 hypothetical protein [Mechercharimyces sp. CAU 1602]